MHGHFFQRGAQVVDVHRPGTEDQIGARDARPVVGPGAAVGDDIAHALGPGIGAQQAEHFRGKIQGVDAADAARERQRQVAAAAADVEHGLHAVEIEAREQLARVVAALLVAAARFGPPVPIRAGARTKRRPPALLPVQLVEVDIQNGILAKHRPMDLRGLPSRSLRRPSSTS